MVVVLISCVKNKKPIKCKAKDLYDSPWFSFAWRYASSLSPNKVFILSAKYGLVEAETEIEPYEETLNNKSDPEIRLWAKTVLASLSRETDIASDKFVVLAGKKYRRHLLGQLPNSIIPMEGLKIGQQLKWLKDRCPA